MVIERFPDVELADENGLLAVGGDLEPETLELAYSTGIFPWPLDKNTPITWFSPPMRALLFLDEVHLSKKLKREYEKCEYDFRTNYNFEAVIKACAASRQNTGTWITEEMIKAYSLANKRGLSHSFECYEDNQLIGGLYGIMIGKMFAGESMFHLKTNASKLTLCFTIDHLRKNGFEWIDCQQKTPLLSSFGAREVPRKEFLALLKKAINK